MKIVKFMAAFALCVAEMYALDTHESDPCSIETVKSWDEVKDLGQRFITGKTVVFVDIDDTIIDKSGKLIDRKIPEILDEFKSQDCDVFALTSRDGAIYYETPRIRNCDISAIDQQIAESRKFFSGFCVKFSSGILESSGVKFSEKCMFTLQGHGEKRIAYIMDQSRGIIHTSVNGKVISDICNLRDKSTGNFFVQSKNEFLIQGASFYSPKGTVVKHMIQQGFIGCPDRVIFVDNCLKVVEFFYSACREDGIQVLAMHFDPTK
ncbi:MAG: DUF2608 domain-containing protein [Holosporaceae bacterium]|jgi:hypothetical protein|nr:DUF2608 domain-containing protein [Holosporaceae bacterium]